MAECLTEEGDLDYNESGLVNEEEMEEKREDEGELDELEEGEVKDEDEDDDPTPPPPDHFVGGPELGEVTPVRGVRRSACGLEGGEVLSPGDVKPEDVGLCKFFLRGLCSWGNNCKFMHTGGSGERGNYRMFPESTPPTRPPLPLHPPSLPPRPSAPPPGPPPGLPPPMPPYMTRPPRFPPPPGFPPGQMGPRPDHMPPRGDFGLRGPMRFPPPRPTLPFPPPPVPPEEEEESAWEKGLKRAKELMKKASEKRESEQVFMEKRMVMHEEPPRMLTPDLEHRHEPIHAHNLPPPRRDSYPPPQQTHSYEEKGYNFPPNPPVQFDHRELPPPHHDPHYPRQLPPTHPHPHPQPQPHLHPHPHQHSQPPPEFDPHRSLPPPPEKRNHEHPPPKIFRAPGYPPPRPAHTILPPPHRPYYPEGAEHPPPIHHEPYQHPGEHLPPHYHSPQNFRGRGTPRFSHPGQPYEPRPFFRRNDPYHVDNRPVVRPLPPPPPENPNKPIASRETQKEWLREQEREREAKEREMERQIRERERERDKHPARNYPPEEYHHSERGADGGHPHHPPGPPRRERRGSGPGSPGSSEPYDPKQGYARSSGYEKPSYSGSKPGGYERVDEGRPDTPPNYGKEGYVRRDSSRAHYRGGSAHRDRDYRNEGYGGRDYGGRGYHRGRGMGEGRGRAERGGRQLPYNRTVHGGGEWRDPWERRRDAGKRDRSTSSSGSSSSRSRSSDSSSSSGSSSRSSGSRTGGGQGTGPGGRNYRGKGSKGREKEGKDRVAAKAAAKALRPREPYHYPKSAYTTYKRPVYNAENNTLLGEATRTTFSPTEENSGGRKSGRMAISSKNKLRPNTASHEAISDDDSPSPPMIEAELALNTSDYDPGGTVESNNSENNFGNSSHERKPSTEIPVFDPDSANIGEGAGEPAGITSGEEKPSGPGSLSPQAKRFKSSGNSTDSGDVEGGVGKDSRRVELLKQLKAVEEAIAKKRDTNKPPSVTT